MNTKIITVIGHGPYGATTINRIADECPEWDIDNEAESIFPLDDWDNHANENPINDDMIPML